MPSSWTHVLGGDACRKFHEDGCCWATLRQSSCGKQSFAYSFSLSQIIKRCRVSSCSSRSYLEYVHCKSPSEFRVSSVMCKIWHLTNSSSFQLNRMTTPRCALVNREFAFCPVHLMAVNAIIFGLQKILKKITKVSQYCFLKLWLRSSIALAMQPCQNKLVSADSMIWFYDLCTHSWEVQPCSHLAAQFKNYAINGWHGMVFAKPHM